MEKYTSFAQVYDEFMDNIPYEEWAEYLIGFLKEFNINNGLLLDLGCGTGTLTEILARFGYDMIGIDNSSDMLEIAQEKKYDSELDILYLLQDMREFELYGTVKAVISICDSINYITDFEDLVTVFKLVNNYLDPKGIFIFDLNTIYKYKYILSDNTIAEDRENMSFIWDNYFDNQERINEYNLNLFIKQDNNLYKKYTEIHYQKAYEIDEIKEAIRLSGMELITIYDAFTKNPPKEDSERLYFIVREKGKEII